MLFLEAKNAEKVEPTATMFGVDQEIASEDGAPKNRGIFSSVLKLLIECKLLHNPHG